QIQFFPKNYLKGLVEQMDHSVFILSDADPHALKGIDGKKIMMRGQALKPFMDWRHEKEWKGKFTWTIGLYGTPAMAKEAGLSEKEYWNQIIKACFLNEKNPIAKWKSIAKNLQSYIEKLNKMKIEKVHIEGADADLWITIGKNRQWLGG